MYFKDHSTVRLSILPVQTQEWRDFLFSVSSKWNEKVIYLYPSTWLPSPTCCYWSAWRCVRASGPCHSSARWGEVRGRPGPHRWTQHCPLLVWKQTAATAGTQEELRRHRKGDKTMYRQQKVSQYKTKACNRLTLSINPAAPQPDTLTAGTLIHLFK